MSDAIANIPYLGIGLGFRKDIADALDVYQEEIDLLELIPTHFVEARQMQGLSKMVQTFPCVLHDVSLSIGSSYIDWEHLGRMRRVSEYTRAPYFSDHLCVSQTPGIDLGHLSPLWYTREVLENVVRKVDTIQNYLGKPLVLETISYSFEIPLADFSQPEFFQHLTRRTGCGILLDVENLRVNSINHRFDPLHFLEAMPLDHVVQVHLAGGIFRDEKALDTHSHPVSDTTWTLFETLATKADVKAVILERDQNFPHFGELVDELRKARAIMAKSRPLEDLPLRT